MMNDLEIQRLETIKHNQEADFTLGAIKAAHLVGTLRKLRTDNAPAADIATCEKAAKRAIETLAPLSKRVLS